MASIADFENLLHQCRLALNAQTKAQGVVLSLPESEFKSEMLASMSAGFATARNTERLAREALNRERAELN